MNDQAVWSTRSDPPDPIFTAIDAHREAVTALETMNAKVVAEDLHEWDGPFQVAPAGLSIAFAATFAPATAFMDTAPTTHAGLRAFESYLLEDSMGPRMVRHMIKYPRTVEGITFTASGDSPEGVDWFITKRAAEIDRAA
jgi:hypothetical protein